MTGVEKKHAADCLVGLAVMVFLLGLIPFTIIMIRMVWVEDSSTFVTVFTVCFMVALVFEGIAFFVAGLNTIITAFILQSSIRKSHQLS